MTRKSDPNYKPSNQTDFWPRFRINSELVPSALVPSAIFAISCLNTTFILSHLIYFHIDIGQWNGVIWFDFKYNLHLCARCYIGMTSPSYRFSKINFFRVVWDKTIFETWKVENHFKITLKWFYEIIGSLRKFYLCKIMDNLFAGKFF